MSVAYWKKEAEKARRQSRFAWGQYFQVRNELFEHQVGIYEFMENEPELNLPEFIKDEDKISIHLQNFISELYKKSKTYVECSICLEVISAEELDTTPCGHNFHKNCLNTLKENREQGSKTVPCPMCRKDLWCFKSK